METIMENPRHTSETNVENKKQNSRKQDDKILKSNRKHGAVTIAGMILASWETWRTDSSSALLALKLLHFYFQHNT